MSKFIRGTVILLIAGFITKILGFINRIVIARFIGEEGVGLYMMALPSLFLVIAVVQLGMPIAISKFVAEASAKGDHQKTKKILVVSLCVTGGLSLIFTPLLFVSAPYLSTHVFTDSRTLLPLLAIAPIVPITAVSAVLRGYFQGKQNMKPYAISNIIEQIVRISMIAALTKAFLPYGIEYAAAGAMIASVFGEIASLLYLMMMFKFKKTFRMRKQFFQYVSSGKNTLKELLSIAIPTTGSRMIGSVTWFIEPIVVARSLLAAGVATSVATGQYGELAGYAVPLLMLPSFITHSLGTSLVPAVSEAYYKGNVNQVIHRLQQSLRFAFLSGSLAVVTLYVLAEPIMQVMYHNSHASIYVKFMAPFFLLFFFQGPLQATLQALNMARAAMFNSLIGSLTKIILIITLVTQPSIGIMGAAIAICVSTVLVTLLHFATVMKKIHLTVYLHEYIMALVVMSISGLLGHMLYTQWAIGTPLTHRLILSITLILSSFAIGCLLTGLIRKKEIKRVPFIGPLLSKFALFP